MIIDLASKAEEFRGAADGNSATKFKEKSRPANVQGNWHSNVVLEIAGYVPKSIKVKLQNPGEPMRTYIASFESRKIKNSLARCAFLILAVIFSGGLLHAQNWSGILAPSRAIDWSNAGVVGGIPARTTIYKTLSAPSTAAQINSALASCPAGEVVLLNPGTYSLTGSVDMQGTAGCTLRGSGANQTFLVFTGTSSCNSTQASSVCLGSSDNNFKTGPSSGPVNVSGNLAAGSTTITLASVPNLKVGNPIILDQLDSTSDNGAILVTDSASTFSSTSPGIAGPYSLQANGGGAQRSGRQQEQIVVVTGCGGVTTPGASCSGTNVSVTIAPGLYMPNWSSASSPQAWWSSSPGKLQGVEDLSIDNTNNSGALGVELFNCINCWVKGIRSIDPLRDHVQFTYSTHGTVQDSYFYLTQGWTTASYGVEFYSGSDSLIENNIFQAVASPYMLNGPGSGSVFGYNFSIMNFFNTSLYNQNAHGDHTAGVDTALAEGNVGNSVNADVIHGTHNLMTYFRNRFSGPAPACWASSSNTSNSVQAFSTGTFGTCNSNLEAISADSFSRFYNIIGNVLGTTGVNTVYESSSNNNPAVRLGLGNGTVPPDPNVKVTAMLWGNCDSGTGFGSCRFNASEVPSGLSGAQGPFANPVPASQTLPASFYHSSKPAWWPSSKPWPAIGPDVTGGNIAGVGGHAYTNPAQDCYTNVMGGTANGTGAALTFNEASCYSTNQPAPPTSLGITVN